MSVDKETVARIARLARLKVDEAQQEALAGELNAILGWIDELGELNSEGVEPMTSVVATRPPLRKDAVNDGGKADDVLANAPAATAGFFTVPKVVE